MPIHSSIFLHWSIVVGEGKFIHRQRADLFIRFRRTVTCKRSRSWFFMHIFRINIRDSHSPSERSFVTSRNILLLIEFVDDECAGSMGESISLDLLVNGPRELDDDRVEAGRVVRSFLQSFSSLLPAYFNINKADCDLKTLRGSARLFILKIHSCLGRQVGCLESFWKTSFVFTTFPITDQEHFFSHISKRSKVESSMLK